MHARCGSNKTRLQVVLSCMARICQSPFIRPADSLVVHTCNGDIKWRCTCQARSYQHGRLLSDLSNYAGNTGITRLWDGMLTSYYDMRQHDEGARHGKKVVRYMLVFTDGGDNGSNTQVDKLAATLARPGMPNFHVVVIAAGVDAVSLQRLRQLCVPEHCTLISVQSASEVDISRAFEQALNHVRLLVVRMSNGEQHIISHNGNARAARQFDQAVSQQLAGFRNLSILDLAGKNNSTKLLGNGGGGSGSRPSSCGRSRGSNNSATSSQFGAQQQGGGGGGRHWRPRSACRQR